MVSGSIRRNPLQSKALSSKLTRHRYWDLPFNNFNYSYVDVATDDYNYYTLSFDRLGTGQSSHGEPLNEMQIFLEVAATAQLSMMLRNGTFPGVNQSFKKVVHVGHSYGSIISYILTNLYPTISDGLVLTGFSLDLSFLGFFAASGNFEIASKNQPLRFGSLTSSDLQSVLSTYAAPLLDYLGPIDTSSMPAPQMLPNGYIITSDIAATKYIFFKPQCYDPAVLMLAEKTKQPATLGQLLTLGSLPMMSDYAGPLMVMNGGMFHLLLSPSPKEATPSNVAVTDSDLPFCGSDCYATGGAAPSIPATVKKGFPNVTDSDFMAYVQPNSGHGLNFHYNATGGYKVIQEFLGSKSLKSW
jgi:pimeloyl-ACP methyl ester carboxylesterase